MSSRDRLLDADDLFLMLQREGKTTARCVAGVVEMKNRYAPTNRTHRTRPGRKVRRANAR